MKNIVVIGCSGAIGSAFTKQFSSLYPDATIHGISRHEIEFSRANVVNHILDFSQESDIEAAASVVVAGGPIDAVIIATGILHDGDIKPEKSLKELSAAKFHHVFEVNTILPALMAKHFLPLLNKEKRSLFAVLSARVGSISDNQLGGWYAYRASKAALNMILKNAAIEIHRSNKNAIVVGLHPGTVDSHLSKPFQANLVNHKIFTPEYAVENMISVLEKLTPEQSGKCYAWDGAEIAP